MADMKKVYDDLVIINLYLGEINLKLFSERKHSERKRYRHRKNIYWFVQNLYDSSKKSYSKYNYRVSQK